MVIEVTCSESTVMEFETPVIVAAPVSVEVMVCMDGVKRLTEKLPVPLVNTESAGNTARGSLLVK
jgi:hypothetical protein